MCSNILVYCIIVNIFFINLSNWVYDIVQNTL